MPNEKVLARLMKAIRSGKRARVFVASAEGNTPKVDGIGGIGLSCHCYRVEVVGDAARIVMPHQHADWCPAQRIGRDLW